MSSARISAARWLLLGALGVHLALVITVSIRELSWLIANKLTLISDRYSLAAQFVEDVSVAALGENLAPTNFYTQTIATYLNVAGIQGGYGFFAPNISDSYRLEFEFHFADGKIERDLPRVGSEEGAVRLAGLLDQIDRTRVEVLREALVKMLATQTWCNHPDAISVRAIFSAINRESREGDMRYVYEFQRE